MFVTVSTAAIVSFAINAKGFGFAKDGNIAIFVRSELLEEAGFVRADFKIDSSVTSEYECKKDGRYRAVRILQIGDKLSPKFCREVQIDSDKTRGLVLKKLTIAGVERTVIEYRAYTLQADGSLKLECRALNAQHVREEIGLVREVANLKALGGKTNVPQKIEGKAKKAV